MNCIIAPSTVTTDRTVWREFVAWFPSVLNDRLATTMVDATILRIAFLFLLLVRQGCAASDATMMVFNTCKWVILSRTGIVCHPALFLVLGFIKCNACMSSDTDNGTHGSSGQISLIIGVMFGILEIKDGTHNDPNSHWLVLPLI